MERQKKMKARGKNWAGLVLLLLSGFCGACGGPGEKEEEAGEAGEAGVRRFEVRGVVQEIKEEGKVLVIDHEEMPGYMRAMVMPFRVKDLEESTGLEPGDEIGFTYVVAELSSWIEGIRRTGEKRAIREQSMRGGEELETLLGLGEAMPDYPFWDEEGREVTLSDFRGGVVALTFVFTRCPVPEFCPAMMRNFAAVREALTKDPEAPESWRLLTISFDTLYDTPGVMKAYGRAFGQDGRNWSMLSAMCCSMEELAAKVGLKFGEVNGSYEHNLRTVVLDGEGRIAQVFTDETWSPESLVAAMKAAAGDSKSMAGT